ncbi:MAG: thiamine phosphate synthase [Pseudomonadota bacterium]
MKGVYLVTDPRYQALRPMETLVAEAARAGVTCVQLREKTAGTRDFVDLALRIKAVLKPFRVPLIINDRIDVALAAGADGVHIGQTDMPYTMVRNLMGPDALIGLSVETWEDVLAAQDLDVDYLGVSPVYATPTKTDTKQPWGLDGLTRIRSYSRHPLVAIGGLNAENAADVIRAGAHCVAVVSAICGADDPFLAAKDLARTVEMAIHDKENSR